MNRAALALAVLTFTTACEDGGFRSPDSYLLLAPAKDAPPPGGLPLVQPLATDAPAAQVMDRLFAEGFASELLRTLYLAKQFVRDGQPGGHPAPPEGKALAGQGLPVVIGLDVVPYGRGLATARWLRGPVAHPGVPFLGLPAEPDRDRALVQTVSGRLATYVLHLALTGGTFVNVDTVIPPALGDGYRMAMEVVAREWRTGRGPQGVVPFDAGTAAQRQLFADVRENRFILGPDRRSLRPARELLADAGVAATVLYRLAQAKTIAGRVAPPEFYQPFAANRLPPGVSPAAVLGQFRNFQAKLLGAWADAVQRGHAPRDIADLVDVYAATFPAEKADVLRMFVVTTFAATVEPGGVSIRPEDATRSLAAIDATAAAVASGRRGLRDAAK
jgi:hypothetical protein